MTNEQRNRIADRVYAVSQTLRKSTDEGLVNLQIKLLEGIEADLREVPVIRTIESRPVDGGKPYAD